MKYYVQAEWLKLIATGETLSTLNYKTGIQQTRLHRLMSGQVEVTLREAYLFSKLGSINLLSDRFIEEHLYSADMKRRQSKNFTLDNR